LRKKHRKTSVSTEKLQSARKNFRQSKENPQFYVPNINETTFTVLGVADQVGSPAFKYVISSETVRDFSLL
jgi:hypothetical protein